MLRNSVSRRPLVFVTLGLLIMAAMIVGLASKTALADEGMPFRGNFTVAISFAQGPSACGVGDNCLACVPTSLLAFTLMQRASVIPLGWVPCS